MSDKRRLLITVSLIITCIASSFLQTALTTALPPIISDLNISVASGQWLTSGYSLAMGIMMPLTAFLITRCPAKKLYLGAIGMFLIGLAVCIAANSFPVMMVGRILQACSNGITVSMAQVVILSIYPADRRGTAMGWYGLSVGAAPVIAPTIAGVLVDSVGWRMIFIIAFVILALSFVMALCVFGDVLETHKNRFDVMSFVLSAMTFGGVTLGVGNISSYGMGSVHTWCPLAIGIIAGVIFARRQLAQDEPFLNLRILKEKDYTFSVIGSMLLYLVMMGSSIIMPLYIQSILGMSAKISGLVTLPGSLAMAIVSPFAGRMYDRFGMRKLAIAGTILMLASTCGMCFIGVDTSVLVAAALNVVRCVAIGCLMMPFVTFGVSSIDTKNTAHGTALLTSLRTISGAIGSAVFVGILGSVSESASVVDVKGAGMHGLHVTFACMTVVTVIMLVLMVAGVRDKNRE